MAIELTALPLTPTEPDDVLVLDLGRAARAAAGAQRPYGEVVRAALKSRPRPRPGVAVDLGRVDVLSSTGVGVLVRLRKELEAEGRGLVLFGVQPDVRRQLEWSTLGSLFTIAPDRPAALALLRSDPSA
jgi:anti-anti-sigma factor